jgi:hypothetical protein
LDSSCFPVLPRFICSLTSLLNRYWYQGHRSHQPHYETSSSRPNSPIFTIAQPRNELHPYHHHAQSRRQVLLPPWVFTKLRQHTEAANDDPQIAPDWLEDLLKACEDLPSIPILRNGTSASLGPQKLNGRYFKADLASFQAVYGSGGMIHYGSFLLRDFEAYEESLNDQAKCSLPTSEDIARALLRYKMVETIRTDPNNRCCYSCSMQTSRKGSRVLERAHCLCTYRVLGACMGQKRIRSGS